jgi:hypothetical protein
MKPLSPKERQQRIVEASKVLASIDNVTRSVMRYAEAHDDEHLDRVRTYCDKLREVGTQLVSRAGWQWAAHGPWVGQTKMRDAGGNTFREQGK